MQNPHGLLTTSVPNTLSNHALLKNTSYTSESHNTIAQLYWHNLSTSTKLSLHPPGRCECISAINQQCPANSSHFAFPVHISQCFAILRNARCVQKPCRKIRLAPENNNQPGAHHENSQAAHHIWGGKGREGPPWRRVWPLNDGQYWHDRLDSMARYLVREVCARRIYSLEQSFKIILYGIRDT